MSEKSPSTDWRKLPGFSLQSGPRPQMLAALLDDFLKDKTSPALFTESTRPKPIWGTAVPYERKAKKVDELLRCRESPGVLENLLAVVEPWPHVGVNPLGEEVHASRNVAHSCSSVADFDLAMIPLWETGVGDARELARFLSSAQAVVLEGGAPSVFIPSSFEGSQAPQADLFSFYEELLLARGPRSAPCVFICVSHQLACECLLRLLRRAVSTVLEKKLDRPPGSRAMEAISAACGRVAKLGESVRVVAADGRVVADGWLATEFVNTRNKSAEVGRTSLEPYSIPSHSHSGLPGEVLDQHSTLAERGRGVIDAQLAYESRINTDMFHGNIVNEEAMLFANWAFQTLHWTLLSHRRELAVSDLAWLLELPSAVEIVASTHKDGEVETACASTCIYYRDLETKRFRRSWTCQFHPELQEDLRDFGVRPAPTFAELKKDDGARLLMRLLRAGLSD